LFSALNPSVFLLLHISQVTIHNSHFLATLLLWRCRIYMRFRHLPFVWGVNFNWSHLWAALHEFHQSFLYMQVLKASSFCFICASFVRYSLGCTIDIAFNILIHLHILFLELSHIINKMKVSISHLTYLKKGYFKGR
jgi:hypothetical protein